MAIFRNVHITFWTDAKVVDDFTPEDKYFYVYLLTNPHTNLCGCYEISLKQMSDELGYNKETVERMIERFSKIHNVLAYDKETKEMLIYNWYKYNWTKSPKLQAALMKEIPKVKCPEFNGFLNGIVEGDTVSIPYPYPMDTPDTDTITDTISNTDIDKNKKSEIYSAIVDHLNEKAGTKYRANGQATQRHINARIAEGFTVDDFKTVIDKKCDEWKGGEMEKYLRPETLFGTKFESYLNANTRKGGVTSGSNARPDDTITDKVGTWL
jgi:uncharacterized phage protein (TIGR02220 family)